MPKLQRIKRANGSLSFSVNIPLEIIEQLGWKKGIRLEPEVQDEIETKSFILVFRKEEDPEEKINGGELNGIKI